MSRTRSSFSVVAQVFSRSHVLIFIVADTAGSLARSVDQVLPATECMVVSTMVAPKVGHIGLGLLGIFSMV